MLAAAFFLPAFALMLVEMRWAPGGDEGWVGHPLALITHGLLRFSMISHPDLQKLSNCALMTAAAFDSAGAKLSTHDHERLHTGSAGAHPSRKFSSRAPRAAEAVDSPAPAVDSRASCPPTPPTCRLMKMSI